MRPEKSAMTPEQDQILNWSLEDDGSQYEGVIEPNKLRYCDTLPRLYEASDKIIFYQWRSETILKHREEAAQALRYLEYRSKRCLKYDGLRELFTEPGEECDSEAELEPYSHTELEPIIEESEDDLSTEGSNTTREAKLMFHNKLSKLFEEYSKILIVGSLNVGSQSLSKIRAELRAVDGLLSYQGVFMNRQKAVEYLWSNEYDGLRELFTEPGEELDPHTELRQIIEELENVTEYSSESDEEDLDLSEAMKDSEGRYKDLLNFLESKSEDGFKKVEDAQTVVPLNLNMQRPDAQYRARVLEARTLLQSMIPATDQDELPVKMTNKQYFCSRYKGDARHRESANTRKTSWRIAH